MLTNVTTYYHYDLNGALVKQFDSSATYFQYGANQLVTQVAPTGVSPWNFGYDAGLNRYTIDKGGTVSYYLWDGLNLLEERDSSGNLIARYSYGYSSIYGIGSCVEIYQQASEHKYTLVMDHRGTAYVLLDETGTEVGRRWYDAFGVLLGSTGSWPVDLGYQTNWLSFNIGGMDVGLSKYRIYVPGLGRFSQRDPLISNSILNRYLYSSMPSGDEVDPKGLNILTRCPIDEYLRNKLVTALPPVKIGQWFIYQDAGEYDGTWLDAEIITTMIREGWDFKIKGAANDRPDIIKNLEEHIRARVQIVQNALSASFGFGPMSIPDDAPDPDNVTPQEYFDAINRPATRMGCAEASARCFRGGVGTWDDSDRMKRDVYVWVPGDWGYIFNDNFKETTWADGYQGENLIYTGSDLWWGHLTRDQLQHFKKWESDISKWTSENGQQHGSPRPRAWVSFPPNGLEK